MRAQVVIEHVMLSDGYMNVSYADGRDRTFEVFTIKSDEAEYQLLAQAVDRFVTVQRERAKVRAQSE
jgi:hypothetical protein